MKIKIFLYTLLICLSAPLALMGASAADASRTLQKIADGISSHQSIKCVFSLKGQQSDFKGTLVISGERFKVTAQGYQTWYDGETQWTFNEAQKEVTVSEPTPSELEQVNPFAIFNSFRRAYTASFGAKPKPGTTKILLKANSAKAQISSVELTVNSKTNIPEKIVIVSDGNQTTVINIISFTKGGALPADTFRYDPAQHPGVEINDMR